VLASFAAGRPADGKLLHDGNDVVLDRASDGSTVEYLNGGGIDNKLRQRASTAPGNPQYFLQDHLGSTIAMTDVSGGVLERQSYEPFGATSGSALTRYGYTGREMDSQTGLMYYRARWYDPQQSRFISEDPIGGMNQYTYGSNNPIIYGDPLGLDGWVMPTLKGATGAFNEDNGMPAPPGEQNSLGRGIGHGIAIVQGLQEIAGGIGLFL
jgi:RHS repeat-associated protein